MQDFSALEGKSLAELREIGRALGMGNVMLKKKELLEQIKSVAMTAPDTADRPAEVAETPVSAEVPKRRGRRPRMAGVRVEGRTAGQPSEQQPQEPAAKPAVAAVPELSCSVFWAVECAMSSFAVLV